jgi:small-conductance mechanosensitive channel
MRTFTLSQGDSLVINNSILLRARGFMGIGADMVLRGASATLVTRSNAFRDVRNGDDFPFVDGELLVIKDHDSITIRARYSRACPTHIYLIVDGPEGTTAQKATLITDTSSTAPELQPKPINWFKLLAGPVSFIIGVAAFAYFDGWLTALVFIASTVLFFILG